MTTDNGPIARGEIVITHEIGLHARPSVKLTKLAKKFQSTIRLRRELEGDWINAKSITKVMALKARMGERIHFEAEGPDSTLAVDALSDLVRRNFDEAP